MKLTPGSGDLVIGVPGLVSLKSLMDRELLRLDDNRFSDVVELYHIDSGIYAVMDISLQEELR
jgi:hypothetical protein